MNVLMLNYEFPPIGGGASPVSYDIGKGLSGLGHKITVVTMRYKGLPAYEEKDGMAIYRVRCWRAQEMVCHPWEQATYILSAAHFIRRKLRIQDFDICYAHFIIPTGAIALWCREKYGLPYVITAHGSDVIGHNERFKWLYGIVKKPWRKIVREASCVVSPSVYLEGLMASTEPGGRYEVIQNGIDTGFYRKSTDKEKKILVMCRLQESKNVQCIIKALGQVEPGDWEVDILGDGPYKEKLQGMVRECHLEQSVTFKGWVENKGKEHLAYLQKASIFISASKAENCPTSILEAAACGARLLLSDIPAHRQLAEPIDKDAFFQDEGQLAGKLGELMRKYDQGDTANHYEMQPFGWEAAIGKYSRLLEAEKK